LSLESEASFTTPVGADFLVVDAVLANRSAAGGVLDFHGTPAHVYT